MANVGDVLRSLEGATFRYHSVSRVALGDTQEHEQGGDNDVICILDSGDEESDQEESSDSEEFIQLRPDGSTPGESFIAVGELPKAVATQRSTVPAIQGDPRCPWRPLNYLPETYVPSSFLTT